MFTRIRISAMVVVLARLLLAQGIQKRPRKMPGTLDKATTAATTATDSDPDVLKMSRSCPKGCGRFTKKKGDQGPYKCPQGHTPEVGRRRNEPPKT